MKTHTDKAEIRDTTGNVLRPGMYGYETALARRNTETLMQQRASDKVKAVTDSRTLNHHEMAALNCKHRMNDDAKRTIPAEKPTDVPDDGSDGFEREDGSETQHGSVESERDSYKAHAAQLAEALKTFVSDKFECPDYEGAKEALSNYEKPSPQNDDAQHDWTETVRQMCEEGDPRHDGELTHADKLAEALREIVAATEPYLDLNEWRADGGNIKAKQALAAYESEVK